jgi:hypothetical protein
MGAPGSEGGGPSGSNMQSEINDPRKKALAVLSSHLSDAPEGEKESILEQWQAMLNGDARVLEALYTLSSIRGDGGSVDLSIALGRGGGGSDSTGGDAEEPETTVSQITFEESSRQFINHLAEKDPHRLEEYVSYQLRIKSGRGEGQEAQEPQGPQEEAEPLLLGENLFTLDTTGEKFWVMTNKEYGKQPTLQGLARSASEAGKRFTYADALELFSDKAYNNRMEIRFSPDEDKGIAVVPLGDRCAIMLSYDGQDDLKRKFLGKRLEVIVEQLKQGFFVQDSDVRTRYRSAYSQLISLSPKEEAGEFRAFYDSLDEKIADRTRDCRTAFESRVTQATTASEDQEYAEEMKILFQRYIGWKATQARLNLQQQGTATDLADRASSLIDDVKNLGGSAEHPVHQSRGRVELEDTTHNLLECLFSKGQVSETGRIEMIDYYMNLINFGDRFLPEDIGDSYLGLARHYTMDSIERLINSQQAVAINEAAGTDLGPGRYQREISGMENARQDAEQVEFSFYELLGKLQSISAPSDDDPLAASKRARIQKAIQAYGYYFVKGGQVPQICANLDDIRDQVLQQIMQAEDPLQLQEILKKVGGIEGYDTNWLVRIAPGVLKQKQAA